MAVEMVFGAKRSILFTAVPATNKCAVGRLAWKKSARVVLDMIVQVLDGRKHTIARSGILGQPVMIQYEPLEGGKSYPVTSSFHLHMATWSISLKGFSWRTLVLMAGEALAVPA
jgi:hypothetical protein